MTRKEEGKRTAVKLKHGEYAVRLQVNKPVRCQECKRRLNKNEQFWLDFIPLRRPVVLKTHYTKVICEACWRGPRNVWRERKSGF